MYFFSFTVTVPVGFAPLLYRTLFARVCTLVEWVPIRTNRTPTDATVVSDTARPAVLTVLTGHVSHLYQNLGQQLAAEDPPKKCFDKSHSGIPNCFQTSLPRIDT